MTAIKKVVLVVTKSNFGGAQRYCLDLARELAGRDIAVAVAHGPGADGTPGILASHLVAANIRSILLPDLTRDIHLVRDLAALQALIHLFAEERPDVVHLNSSKAGGLGALAARIARTPRIVFTLHGFPGDEARSRLSRWLIICMTWCTMLLSHTTITVNAQEYERMRRMPLMRRKVVLVRSGVVSPTFLSPKEARVEIRTLAPTLPTDGRWLGCIAELHPNKDHATLIRALLEVPEAHLVLVGDGENRAALSALAEELRLSHRVHILGFVPEAARYLRAFDCLALSSRKEGLPYVLLEAGCAYVPVVATNVGGIPDLIMHEFTGLLVPPGEPKALGAALERVMSNATLARSLSEELLKRVRGSFSPEMMIEKTLAAYQRKASASSTI